MTGNVSEQMRRVLWMDKGKPKGWLYDWEDIAAMGKQNPETRLE
jgi:hypothetical protein